MMRKVATEVYDERNATLRRAQGKPPRRYERLPANRAWQR
ncbi:MAG: hypothetical protein JWQ40_884 [Segetibacter sp.]|nr:hypothetical protein [Segetibacter sp.]